MVILLVLDTYNIQTNLIKKILEAKHLYKVYLYKKLKNAPEAS